MGQKYGRDGRSVEFTPEWTPQQREAVAEGAEVSHEGWLVSVSYWTKHKFYRICCYEKVKHALTRSGDTVWATYTMSLMTQPHAAHRIPAPRFNRAMLERLVAAAGRVVVDAELGTPSEVLLERILSEPELSKVAA